MKTAIITGASRGIGAATAAALAREGYAVCINYIERRDKAEELCAALRAEGHVAMIYRADVADRDAVDKMLEKVHEELGNVSLLVNNAGIAKQQMFQDIDSETWKRVFEVNLGGCFNCTQAVLPDMLRVHEGCIVNVSSIWGSHGASCEALYSCTKHAIIGLTRSLSAELAPSGIRVNCVAPGVIETDMCAAVDPEIMVQLANESCVGRNGTAEDVAKAFLYLAEADFVTGQVLPVNGGFVL